MRTRFNISRRLEACALACLLASIGLSTAQGYVLSGQRWPYGHSIVMNLGLGVPEKTLTDGSTSWDAVAEAALSVWNPYLGNGVQFVGVEEGVGDGGYDDGVNQVFFSSTLYGEDFGDDTLAVTHSVWDDATNIKSEADVVVNNAKPFDSYRGSLEVVGVKYVFDLRRVLIHEFGHVLGLNHVSQETQSIMTPDTSNIDTVQADDIAGVKAIYGSLAPNAPVIVGGLSTGGVLGQSFVYQIGATNSPTSYEASNLPPGLTLNASAGQVFGVPTVAGTYQVPIGATNVAGTGRATLTLVFEPMPMITSPLTATAYAGYPFYYRITASGNPTMFGIGGGLPAGMTLDTATGVISGTPAVGFLSIDVTASNAVATGSAAVAISTVTDATLRILHSRGNGTAEGLDWVSLVKGMDGNLYGLANGGGANGDGVFFRFAPGTETFTKLYDFTNAGDMNPTLLRQAPDGSFYGTTSSGGATSQGTLFKLTANGTMTTLASFNPPDHAAPHSSVILGRDGSYYGTLSFPNAVGISALYGSIYKFTPDGTLTTLHQFTGDDGASPNGLVQGKDGNFYGTTIGVGGNSTAFEITPDGVFTMLHAFTADEGEYVSTPLIQGMDGNFYGTAGEGGTLAGGFGTVFKMTPSGTLAVLHSFSTSAEGYPTGLAQGIDGSFYGILQRASGGCGIFELKPDGTLTMLHQASGTEGEAPFLALIPNLDGTLYGASQSTIFKETPGAVPPVPPTVTLAATTPRVTVGSGGTGTFTVSLAAPQTVPVIVYYTVKGSAINGTDYVFLKGKKKIKPGKTSKTIQVIPQGDLGGEYSKKVKLVLQPDAAYTVGTTGPAKVKIISPSGGSTD